MYIVGYIENMGGPEYIKVKSFRSPQKLLDFLVYGLGLYEPDYDYEPDENYEADLATVLDYINSNIGLSDSDPVLSITITKGDEILVQL